jgi:hypothetical protein
LGELEFLQFQLAHDVVSKDVGGGKKPTPTTVLLVRDRSRLEVQSMVKDVLVCDSG